MADDDNVAQDVMNSISQPVRSIYERVTHIFGDPTTPADTTKQTDAGKLPDAWESANKQVQQQKLDESKPLSQRTLGGVKRPPIKKPATTQTQRKQP